MKLEENSKLTFIFEHISKAFITNTILIIMFLFGYLFWNSIKKFLFKFYIVNKIDYDNQKQSESLLLKNQNCKKLDLIELIKARINISNNLDISAIYNKQNSIPHNKNIDILDLIKPIISDIEYNLIKILNTTVDYKKEEIQYYLEYNIENINLIIEYLLLTNEISFAERIFDSSLVQIQILESKSISMIQSFITSYFKHIIFRNFNQDNYFKLEKGYSKTPKYYPFVNNFNKKTNYLLKNIIKAYKMIDVIEKSNDNEILKIEKYQLLQELSLLKHEMSIFVCKLAFFVIDMDYLKNAKEKCLKEKNNVNDFCLKKLLKLIISDEEIFDFELLEKKVKDNHSRDFTIKYELLLNLLNYISHESNYYHDLIEYISIELEMKYSNKFYPFLYLSYYRDLPATILSHFILNQNLFCIINTLKENDISFINRQNQLLLSKNLENPLTNDTHDNNTEYTSDFIYNNKDNIMHILNESIKFVTDQKFINDPIKEELENLIYLNYNSLKNNLNYKDKTTFISRLLDDFESSFEKNSLHSYGLKKINVYLESYLLKGINYYEEENLKRLNENCHNNFPLIYRDLNDEHFIYLELKLFNKKIEKEKVMKRLDKIENDNKNNSNNSNFVLTQKLIEKENQKKKELKNEYLTKFDFLTQTLFKLGNYYIQESKEIMFDLNNNGINTKQILIKGGNSISNDFNPIFCLVKELHLKNLFELGCDDIIKDIFSRIKSNKSIKSDYLLKSFLSGYCINQNILNSVFIIKELMNRKINLEVTEYESLIIMFNLLNSEEKLIEKLDEMLDNGILTNGVILCTLLSLFQKKRKSVQINAIINDIKQRKIILSTFYEVEIFESLIIQIISEYKDQKITNILEPSYCNSSADIKRCQELFQILVNNISLTKNVKLSEYIRLIANKIIDFVTFTKTLSTSQKIVFIKSIYLMNKNSSACDTNSINLTKLIEEIFSNSNTNIIKDEKAEKYLSKFDSLIKVQKFKNNNIKTFKNQNQAQELHIKSKCNEFQKKKYSNISNFNKSNIQANFNFNTKKFKDNFSEETNFQYKLKQKDNKCNDSYNYNPQHNQKSKFDKYYNIDYQNSFNYNDEYCKNEKYEKCAKKYNNDRRFNNKLIHYNYSHNQSYKMKNVKCNNTNNTSNYFKYSSNGANSHNSIEYENSTNQIKAINIRRLSDQSSEHSINTDDFVNSSIVDMNLKPIEKYFALKDFNDDTL